MRKYAATLIQKAKELRLSGKTYSEIGDELGEEIPKNTMSFWFKKISLSNEQKEQLRIRNLKNLVKAREKAVAVNKIQRRGFLEKLDRNNLEISNAIFDKSTAKIALAMLCLGEASKYGTGSGFYLGSSSAKIIGLFLRLLRVCYEIDDRKFRCTLMCRADQNIEELEKYWRGVTGIKKSQFYKARVDMRSVGKPTIKENYKGVLKVDYMDTKVQLDLESLANLVYNRVVAN